MDLDAILDGIKKAGKQQIAQIEQDADRQSNEITSKVQTDANVQRDRILADGKARLNREQALIEQQALIQALQIHADARQSLIENVMEIVKERLPGLRNTKDYEKFLDTLVNEALQSLKPSLLKGQKVILHFDPRDKALAERIAKKIDMPVSLKFDIECSGGCNAESEDSKIFALNTLESRFEHATPYIKQKLSIYFESKVSSS